MRMGRCPMWALLGLALACADLAPAAAQDYGARLGTVKRGGRVSYEPTGPGVLFDALDPALRKWYVPQELYAEYGWQQREYTNYARENYQRYVSTALEGDYWYDAYGNLLTRGWLVYDWRQVNPQPFGSVIEKSSQFSQWFNRLVIASDHKGQYHYSITVGNEIRTTLTPMTLSKPLFNGLQWDLTSDKYAATILLSRISEPDSPSQLPEQSTNNTNLFGTRVEAQVGDFVKVGGTFVNARHSQSQLEAINGDIFEGALTEGQNFGSVSRIAVTIADDSPEDGKGGGALFSSDLVIHDLDGNTARASELGFRPLVEGGFQRRGYLAADGFETITLTYDFNDRTYAGPDPTEIRRVQVEMVVANDYRIDVGSNRQVNARGAAVALPVARARGNVQDGSNQRVLFFDYGVPTANQIAGFTLEMTDLHGFEGYLEVNVNKRYRKYPNPNFQRHAAASDRATGWMLNLSRQEYPWFGFLEAFGMDPDYATSFVVADEEGDVDYDNDYEIFEFVEDNDDQDRYPDWQRKGWGVGDREIFPGWDENHDFISDFNQNDNEDAPNLIPDYEEPFLRYHADRPEFLYGVDANHNGTIDRFENDEEADLPYRRDQRGHNAYGGAWIDPDTRLTVGRMDVRQMSDRRHNRAVYALFNTDKSHPRWGRLRVFQDLRSVEDTIVDDLVQWQQPPNTRGTLRGLPDQLPARDTWINTTWIGLEQAPLPGLSIAHKLKWQVYRQLDDDLTLELRGQRRTAPFLGLINKADYTLNLGSWVVAPRWKSEWRRESPVSRSLPRRSELTELLMLVMRHPIMRRSYMEGGLEYEWFRQLRDPVPAGAAATFTGLTSTLQMTNLTDYQGYRLTTIIGFEVTRLDLKFEPVELRTRGFITIYAGIER